MRKKTLLKITLLLIIALPCLAVAQSTVKTIFPQKINVKSRLVDPPVTNYMMAAWLHQDDFDDPSTAKIMGAVINDTTLKKKRKFNVSQPGSDRYAGPHFDMIYDDVNKQYTVVYQENGAEDNSIAMTTIDHDGKYVDRDEDLANDVGMVLGPIILHKSPWDDTLIAFWANLKDGKIYNNATSFNSADPGGIATVTVSEESRDPYIMLPQAAVTKDGIIHLFTYSFNPNLEKLRFLSRVTYEQDRGFRDIKRIITSSARIQGSTTVTAVASEENFGEDIPIAMTSGNVNSVATIMEGGYFDPISEKIQNRNAPVSTDPRVFDVQLVAAVDNSLDKLVWIQWTEGEYSVKVADIDSSFKVVPNSEIVVDSSEFYSFSDVSAAFVDDGDALVITWSEHRFNGKTLLNGKSISY